MKRFLFSLTFVLCMLNGHAITKDAAYALISSQE